MNRNSNTARKIVPAGYKACISAELLFSLTTLRRFVGCTDVQYVADGHVKTWIKSRSRCTVDETPTHVKNAISRVKFKMNRDVPEGATLQFFTDVMTELRRSRVQHVITESRKVLIGLPIPNLKPLIVRETIMNAYEYWAEEKKYDFYHFMEKVTQTSVQSAKYDKNTDHPSGTGNEGYRKPSKRKQNAGGDSWKKIDPSDDKSPVNTEDKGGVKRKLSWC